MSSSTWREPRRAGVMALHPSSPATDACAPLMEALTNRCVTCDVYTWRDWMGDLSWSPGHMMDRLREDGVDRVHEGTRQWNRPLVLFGHAAGAALAQLVAQDVGAVGVVALSMPGQLSPVTRLLSRPRNEARLAELASSSAAAQLVQLVYGWLTFAGKAPADDQDAIMEALRSPERARKLVRRWAALQRELDTMSVPPVQVPTLSLCPTRGRVTTPPPVTSKLEIRLEIPSVHSAHVKHHEQIATMAKAFVELLVGFPSDEAEVPAYVDWMAGALADSRDCEVWPR